MKRILITGENSYIGGKFTEWVAQWPEKYLVDELSVRGNHWKEISFKKYDVILHVAAIVHQKETKENLDLYYRVNRDLAYKVAKKAKEEGLTQFILMSTMNVYGINSGIITEKTVCNPKTAYGKSKLEAERLVNSLQDDNFSVAIIRPPMVYGPDTVGNYVRLSQIAKISPIFPKIRNKRSMIYINNLTEFIRLLIEKNQNGIFFPQNSEYISTVSLVQEISKTHNKMIYMTRFFNPFLKLLRRINIIEKVFGNLVYDHKISNIYDEEGNKLDYQIVDFIESVGLTEDGI